MADVGDVGDVVVTNFKKVVDLADFSANLLSNFLSFFIYLLYIQLRIRKNFLSRLSYIFHEFEWSASNCSLPF
jgi:hypothetical protein